MSSNSLRFEPLSPIIGAQVQGIDLGAPMTEATFDALHEGWMRHHVLFFRDQPLDIEQLKAFGRRFGELHIHPMGDVEGHPGVTAIYADANSTTFSGRNWHSDVSCDELPPSASILHLHIVPDVGGDTIFGNMYAAYDALSPTFAGFLDGLEARHSGRQRYEDYFGADEDASRDGKFPEAVHPVVRSHPVTGRKALYVNPVFTSHMVGMEPEESAAILGFLYRHIALPDFQCRFRWRQNSVAMWDNRCVVHAAIPDYLPQTRSGYRVTVVGDRPA